VLAAQLQERFGITPQIPELAGTVTIPPR
jgi:hypothetical protein